MRLTAGEVDGPGADSLRTFEFARRVGAKNRSDLPASVRAEGGDELLQGTTTNDGLVSYDFGHQSFESHV